MSIHEVEARRFLRHTLATLAYRAAKPLREAPDGFGGFRAAPSSRTPGEILAHVCDLLDWLLHLCRGKQVWHDTVPQDWRSDVARFFEAIGKADDFLASEEPLGAPPERLFQGPVADAITHVGQIAMLRRIAGAPIRGENYFKAEINVGAVGPSQTAPKIEFD
jgi:hypothetical protein